MYSVILPVERRRSFVPNLGFKGPSWSRLFVRDYRTLYEVAKDGNALATEALLDRVARDMLRESQYDSRAVLSYDDVMDDVVEILKFVSAMLPTVRRVVELRASGRTWDRIVIASPGRVLYSVRQDWDEALVEIRRALPESVSRVAGRVSLSPRA